MIECPAFPNMMIWLDEQQGTTFTKHHHMITDKANSTNQCIIMTINSHITLPSSGVDF